MTARDHFKQYMRAELWFAGVIIAVLAVFFLRSFDGLVDRTEVYKAEQVRDSFKSALRVLHTSWLSAGRPTRMNGLSGDGMTSLTLNEAGWPISVSGTANASEVTDIGCQEVFNTLLQDFYAGADPAMRVSDSASHSTGLTLRVLAVGTVCVFQIGREQQDSFSLLYNAESGEVRMTRHHRP